jgi:hypothetical protein
MKYIKIYEDFRTDLDSLCEKYGIKNYTIKGESVDVDGDVDFSNQKLVKIPIKFGKVSGYFNCYNTRLTSLKNSPKEVGSSFFCDNNALTSLEGGPVYVGGTFYTDNNKLETLEGSPKEVGGDFNCYNNKLVSLKGCPTKIGGALYFKNSDIYTFEFFPKEVGDFDFTGSPLYTLWELFEDKDKIILFNDYDILDNDILYLDRLNRFLSELEKPEVSKSKLEKIKKYYKIKNQ